MPFNLSQIFGGWRKKGVGLKRATRARPSSTPDVKSQKTSDIFPGRVAVKEFSEPARGASQVKSQSELARKLIIAPHISEKSAMFGECRYVFKVADGANKNTLKDAIQDRYGVEVESVNIVAARDKKRSRGQIIGVKSGFKKAVVTLKVGQTISEF